MGGNTIDELLSHRVDSDIIEQKYENFEYSFFHKLK
jgi:hypothetical protein